MVVKEAHRDYQQYFLEARGKLPPVTLCAVADKEIAKTIDQIFALFYCITPPVKELALPQDKVSYSAKHGEPKYCKRYNKLIG